MMKQKRAKRPPGQIRQSQVVTTFGPGAMLDLPNHSVLVAGLTTGLPAEMRFKNHGWFEKLEKLLDVTVLRLDTPPPDQEDPTAPPTGITGWQFPEWFITQDVQSTDPASNGPFPNACSSVGPDARQVHRPKQEEAFRRAGTVCARVPLRAHRRY